MQAQLETIYERFESAEEQVIQLSSVLAQVLHLKLQSIHIKSCCLISILYRFNSYLIKLIIFFLEGGGGGKKKRGRKELVI